LDTTNESMVAMQSLQRFPTSRKLMPSVVDQFIDQEVELKQKEEALQLANTITASMESNIHRLENEKINLVQEAHMLRYQLEEMYNEKERQCEIANKETDLVRKEVESEREEYQRYIKEREADLANVVEV